MYIIFAIVLSIIPGIIWLAYFLLEDPKPEPKHLIALVFLAGAIAIFPAIALEQLFSDWYTSTFSGEAVSMHSALEKGGIGVAGLLIGLAAIEEVLKFLAAYVTIHRSKFFDEAVDAMVYIIVAAMGFATAENIVYSLAIFQEGLSAGFIGMTVIGGVFETTTLRFAGATLLHALGSGLLGYAWAHGVVQRREQHFIGGGIIAATILHTLFNYFIIMFGGVQILYPIALLIVAAILVLYDFEKLRGYPRITRNTT